MAKKQSFHSKAINAVITAIVRVLLGWADVDNGPKVAGAFQDIETSFDIFLEDRLKDNEDFRKEFEKSSPSKDDQGWYSIENNEVK